MQWGVEGECGEGGGDEEVGRVWTGGGVLWVADVGRCGGGGFGRVVRRCVAGVVRDGVAVDCFWMVLGHWLGLFPVLLDSRLAWSLSISVPMSKSEYDICTKNLGHEASVRRLGVLFGMLSLHHRAQNSRVCVSSTCTIKEAHPNSW